MMMIGVNDFLAAVEEIANESPTYRSGGSGDDGTCDCIGLIIGAMRRCGHGKYAMHGSNYFARTQMNDLEGVGPEEVGMLVFKRRNPGESGYALPERYQAGGSGYNGDLGDYYHVGVVTGVFPIEITHCTSAGGVRGIKRDRTEKEYRSWAVAGRLRDVDYGGGQMEKVMGRVKSPNGKPVHLRRTASTKKPYLANVPDGAEVSVCGGVGEWFEVDWNGLHGFMMSEFVELEEQQEEAKEEETVQAADSDVTVEVLENQRIVIEMLRMICEKLDIAAGGVEIEENEGEEVNG